MITARSFRRTSNIFSQSCQRWAVSLGKIFCIIIILHACTRNFKCLHGRDVSLNALDFLRGTLGHVLHFLCHNSWNTNLCFCRSNITSLTKVFNPLGNWIVVWKNCTRSKITIRPEDALRGRLAAKLSLLRRNASTANERCYTLHRFMMTWFSACHSLDL